MKIKKLKTAFSEEERRALIEARLEQDSQARKDVGILEDDPRPFIVIYPGKDQSPVAVPVEGTSGQVLMAVEEKIKSLSDVSARYEILGPLGQGFCGGSFDHEGISNRYVLYQRIESGVLDALKNPDFSGIVLEP